MPIIACKLPHGLTITHQGRTININGSNVNFDALSPDKNGALADGTGLSAGFGLTTLSDQDAAVFEDWSNRALYKDGEKAKGLLEEPFQPLLNGVIKPYKSEGDARKDTSATTTDVATGFDGLDGDAEIKRAAAATPGLVNSGKNS